MRLVPVLIILAIIGGIAYFVLFRKEDVNKFKKEVQTAFQQHVQGYGPAKTPREAMEQFLKAIKDRDYQNAATYATRDYADKLQRAHTACRALGREIDNVNSYIDEKGFKNDKCTQLLTMLDPFPPYVKIGDVKEVQGKQVGAFVLQFPKIEEGWNQFPSRIDPKLVKYQNALGAPVAPPVAPNGLVEIKSEGEGDKKTWKIDFQVPQPVHDGIEWYMNNYKSYLEGLQSFREEIRQGRFLKDQLPDELVDKLAKSK